MAVDQRISTDDLLRIIGMKEAQVIGLNRENDSLKQLIRELTARLESMEQSEPGPSE